MVGCVFCSPTQGVHQGFPLLCSWLSTLKVRHFKLTLISSLHTQQRSVSSRLLCCSFFRLIRVDLSIVMASSSSSNISFLYSTPPLLQLLMFLVLWGLVHLPHSSCPLSIWPPASPLLLLNSLFLLSQSFFISQLLFFPASMKLFQSSSCSVLHLHFLHFSKHVFPVLFPSLLRDQFLVLLTIPISAWC